ncbi:MAG: HAD-IC family P-type ATPase [Planctomycetes bacterium]|nr:HAD-IC family P-type ATPase [Planctomycetota bacterium]
MEGDNGSHVANAGLGDALQPDAAAAIAELRQRGWQVEILSGDHPVVVAAVGRQLGVAPESCHGGVSPEGKLAYVEQAAARGPVVMVGDGVNGAAALAAATTGVAVHGGAEASLAAADVYMTEAGVRGVVRLIAGARRTVLVIRRNLVVSLVYNAAGVALAMAGLLNPLVAAILMPASSLTVISLSYRSRTFGA